MTARAVAPDAVVECFLHRIAPVRHRIRRLILFGSRARGDHKPYSDYDILIVVPEKERTLVDALYDATMEVLYETGRLVSLKIYREAEFDRLARLRTPFLRNVLEQGVPLG